MMPSNPEPGIAFRCLAIGSLVFGVLTIGALVNASDAESQPAAADTSAAFSSRDNLLLSFPRHLWNFVMYPLGEFTTYSETSRLPERTLDFFMNDARTFGIFPKVQLGGETGSGGGVKIFHANVAGRRKQVEAGFVYSGRRGQMGGVLYHDPSIMGTRGFGRVEASFLRTHNRSASINTSVRDDLTRQFAINQVDASLTLGWRSHNGRLAATRPEVRMESVLGYHFRDLKPEVGGREALTDPGSTSRASELPGIGDELGFGSAGLRLTLDNRDARPPVDEAPHPLFGHLPNQRVLYSDGSFHFYRNTAYPGRGGRLILQAEYAAGPDDVRFIKTTSEVQGYLTLFRPGQVLAIRGRMERIFRRSDGFAPYADLVTLGGGKDLRGFRRGFFRGEGSLLMNIEYRYAIWDTWNAFFFWDEGMVFDTFDEVEWTGFHTGLGGGLAFRTSSKLLVKIQIGYSFAEKPLFGFTFAQDF